MRKNILKNDSHTAFTESIDLEEVRDVCSVMDEYMHYIANGSFNVDNLVERCNAILYKAAENSGSVISLVDRSSADGVARKLGLITSVRCFERTTLVQKIIIDVKKTLKVN